MLSLILSSKSKYHSIHKNKNYASEKSLAYVWPRQVEWGKCFPKNDIQQHNENSATDSVLQGPFLPIQIGEHSFLCISEEIANSQSDVRCRLQSFVVLKSYGHRMTRVG